MAELSLSLPVKGEEAPGADAKVNAAFTEIQTQFNGKVSGVNLEAPVTGLRMFLVGEGEVGSSIVGPGTWIATSGGGITKLSAGTLALTNNHPIFANLNSSDFAITGKTTKAVLAATLITNATAPGINFTFGLAKLETTKGGLNKIEIGYGALLAGSEVTLTTPAAETINNSKTTAFTFPATGAYSPAVTLSGTTAANSLTSFTIQVYAKNE